jgi:predicted acylesterase/phospholipase RssA/molybdopterin/thiamine biosynthesis adenylyltransferase/proteasome lid subunit RPN8/RPN11
MTEGQGLAEEQLREIEAASAGTVEVLGVRETGSKPGPVWITISVYCGDLPRAEGGLPLRQRERLNLLVPEGFPFDHPHAWATHGRFAGFAHVQFGRYLCFYQSPATEWDASDGMYGFIDRLHLWLRRGALNELDETGGPLHPPVTYAADGPIRSLIPRVNTPIVGDENWYGTAHLKTVSDVRVDITGWSPAFAEDTPQGIAAAILLAQPMPFEFPKTVEGLFSELEGRGVPRRLLLMTLQWAILSNAESSPLYLIIGAPMRGIRGAGELKQHLTAWYIHPVLADALRLALEAYKEDLRFQQIGERAEAIFLNWAKEAKVEWCQVSDDRPEIVIRRDEGAATNWFRGRKVSLWGCGALGGHIAEFLTRAGVGQLILRDNGIVGPGILARQPYDDADIGRAKALALRDRLKRIRPELEVVTHETSLLRNPLAGEDWSDGADIIVETTASAAVLAKLELRRRESPNIKAPIVSMAIGDQATRSLVAVAGARFCGGPEDVVRRAKIEVLSRGLTTFSDEFWPSHDGERRRVFQPEPGCSENTFVGSEADIAALASVMLNQAAQDVANMDETSAAGHFFAAPHVASGGQQRADFHFGADIVSPDPGSGYEIRLSRSALSDIQAWMEKSRRERGERIETGGLLFGERDDATKIIWISEVTGPPPDSIASADGFVCGTQGTSELNDEKSLRTRHAVQYLGMWHSHPGSSPVFSSTDLAAMHQLITESSFSPSKSLLLIIGTPSGVPMFGSYLFSRADFSQLFERKVVGRRIAVQRIPRILKPKRIGLALSGGGARAVAFHLGCLRALHDRGLLRQVELLSAVSGGAVIAGLYGYRNDSFDEFDRRVVSLLQSGLQAGIARRTVLSRRAIEILGTNLTAGSGAVGVATLKALLWLLPGSGRIREKLHPPLRRWVTATTAFQDVLNALFGGIKLTDRRRDGLEVIFNACELRTGSAFRFSSSGSYCWRYGALVDNDLPVALAVAASAAYPALLPAIDREFVFKDRGGRQFKQRVILTDGGVFDNLGVTCLEPGRSPEYSGLSKAPDYIIACDAGQGLFDDSVHPFYWPSRMKRAFESVHRKAHDSIRKRLHDHAAAGRLNGFVLSYLGQQDNSLPIIPPDLVRRSKVVDYPTDFRAMSARDIDLIAGRGEQLTRLLVTRYVSEL